MRDLRDEELEKALELVAVAPHRGCERRRVDVGGLERAHVELQPVAEPLDPAEHPHGVALAEAAVEQLDVVPDPRLDAPGRVDELEREVGRAALRAQLSLRLDGEDALDDAVFGQVRNRHSTTLDGASRCGSRPAVAASSPTLVQDGLGLLAPPAERAGDVGRGHLARRAARTLPTSSRRASLPAAARPQLEPAREEIDRDRTPACAPARRRRRSSARAAAAGAAIGPVDVLLRRRRRVAERGRRQRAGVEHRLARPPARGPRRPRESPRAGPVGR